MRSGDYYMFDDMDDDDLTDFFPEDKDDQDERGGRMNISEVILVLNLFFNFYFHKNTY